LGSKAHRVAVANLRAKEEKARHTKRKAEEQEGEEEEEEEEHGQTATATTTKRQRTEEREIAGADEDEDASHAFPMDFFSDPARAPLQTTGEDDEDDEMDQDEGQEQRKKDGNAKSAPPPKSQFDTEWAAFERDMQNLSSTRRQPAGGNDNGEAAAGDPQETTLSYAHATIAAEPELVPRFEGLPVSSDTGAAAQAQEEKGTGLVEEGRKKVSPEQEERRRKELDERELIMDRLLEEERAQEDAYGRVALLKNRIQMLKQKRELAKAKGKNADIDMDET
jgi:zinc finger protein 830